MSILSFEFLVLMAALLAVNYLLPVRLRWLALLTGSLVFYAMAGWGSVAYLTAVALLTWLAALGMSRSLKREQEALNAAKAYRDVGMARIRAELADVQRALENQPDEAENAELLRRKARAEADEAAETARMDKAKERSLRFRYRRERGLIWLILAVVGGMCVIKYANVLYQVVNAAYIALTKSRTPLTALTLIAPLGLSYFTFQSVGYVVDCYRGKAQAEKNPLKYLLFLCFFPQITQGPITTHGQLMPQLVSPRRFDAPLFVEGFQLMLWGYFKKMVLADRIAPVTEAVAKGANQPGWLILLGVTLYAIRLYADFSGGMDVIRGAARMLGVDIIENFRRPFFAASVGEYWRRWHISLGAWFRSYLFYPLTTSRFGLAVGRIGQKLFGKKIGRALPGVLATFLIFLLIGIWHGASWNAVIYGAYFGLLLSLALLLEPLFKGLRKKLRITPQAWWWKAFGMARTWGLMLLAQYFAFTAGPKQGWGLLIGTFRSWDFTKAAEKLTEMMVPLEWYIALGAMAVVLFIDVLVECKVNVNARLARTVFPVRWILLILLILAVLVFGCYGAGYDAAAFLYTNF